MKSRAVDGWMDGEGAAEEEAATAAAGKEDKREEQCVSERVISWKQFTPKQQQQGEKKMLNTMAWAHREIGTQKKKYKEREDRGGERLINMIKTGRDAQHY